MRINKQILETSKMDALKSENKDLKVENEKLEQIIEALRDEIELNEDTMQEMGEKIESQQKIIKELKHSIGKGLDMHYGY